MPRKTYSADIKLQIVKMFEEGTPQSVISARFNINKSIISRMIKRYHERGTVVSRCSPGRPRVTTRLQDNLIKRKCTRDPFLPASQIKAELDLPISSRTIQRRLVEKGLYSRRPAKKPLLTKKHRMNRLAFARQHLHWTIQKWNTVLFSDESKFNMINSDGMCFVRRPVNKRLDPRYYKTTVKHGGGSVLVWGCFSGNGTGPLYCINGIMDRFLYRDILENIMLPYAEEEMPLRWRYQHDNDPKHTAQVVKQWFQENNVTVLPWPSQSPDLNPIENLWEILNLKIRGENRYTNKAEIFSALQRAWTEISPQTIRNLIESMPRRCAAVIKNNGYATKY